MSDICLISADISDICRYLSDIGHIWNLGSFTKAILLQKCSISLICPDIAIRSRSSRSDWLHQIYIRFTSDLLTDGRTNMKNLRPPTQKAPSGQLSVSGGIIVAVPPFDPFWPEYKGGTAGFAKILSNPVMSQIFLSAPQARFFSRFWRPIPP